MAELVSMKTPIAVADLGEGPGAPLFWVKKEEITEGKRASRARKSRPPLLPSPFT